MEEFVGVTKELDNLGRLVIPKEMRRLFGLVDRVEVVLTKEGILIRSPKFRLVKKEDTITPGGTDVSPDLN